MVEGKSRRKLEAKEQAFRLRSQSRSRMGKDVTREISDKEDGFYSDDE